VKDGLIQSDERVAQPRRAGVPSGDVPQEAAS
jgi:hypothetical protein